MAVGLAGVGELGGPRRSSPNDAVCASKIKEKDPKHVPVSVLSIGGVPWPCLEKRAAFMPRHWALTLQTCLQGVWQRHVEYILCTLYITSSEFRSSLKCTSESRWHSMPSARRVETSSSVRRYSWQSESSTACIFACTRWNCLVTQRCPHWAMGPRPAWSDVRGPCAVAFVLCAFG